MSTGIDLRILYAKEISANFRMAPYKIPQFMSDDIFAMFPFM